MTDDKKDKHLCTPPKDKKGLPEVCPERLG